MLAAEVHCIRLLSTNLQAWSSGERASQLHHGARDLVAEAGLAFVVVWSARGGGYGSSCSRLALAAEETSVGCGLGFSCASHFGVELLDCLFL